MVASSPLHATPSATSASSPLWKRDNGCFVCFEQHANASEICGKSFASKQALEGHRGRKGCTPAKLPSDRAYSKYHGLEPGAAHALKRQSNTAAVSKYRHTLDGKRAVFRARHISKLRSMVIDAVPAPPMPKAPNFVRPPISWLIADAQLLPFEVPELFESGKTGLSHKTWSLKYHPDKVEAKVLLCFVEHFMGSATSGLTQEQAKALYATELFAPLNDERFKPGLIAQKSRGMLWRAWMNVEYALVDEYAEYLQEFREYKVERERVIQKLEGARARWIENHLDQKFRNSRGFKQHVAQNLN